MGLLETAFATNGQDPNLDYQTTLARALQEKRNGADYSPVGSPWQGVARMAQGAMGAIDEQRALAAAQGAAGQMASLLGSPNQPTVPQSTGFLGSLFGTGRQ